MNMGVIIWSLSRSAGLSAGKTEIACTVEDREVIERVHAGDIDAFEMIIEKYGSYVFGIVSNRVPFGSVEDVAHEVFLNAYQSLPFYRPTHPFKHWLSRIAVRRCYDYWRKAKRSKEVPISTLSAEHESWVDAVCASKAKDDFAAGTDRQEARELLDWALATLSPEDRSVLTLVYLDGLSVKEASDLLDWSASKVKVRAHRARKQMRDRLERFLEREP